jgi:hypothetical protein
MRDLFGNRIPAPIVPHCQLAMFDRTEFAGAIGMDAIGRRENGEQVYGMLCPLNRVEKQRLTFVERETGKTYSIPLRCCTVTWADRIAVVSIDDRELFRNTSLWGMFASCRLF